jgi:hypothetical protein
MTIDSNPTAATNLRQQIENAKHRILLVDFFGYVIL